MRLTLILILSLFVVLFAPLRTSAQPSVPLEMEPLAQDNDTNAPSVTDSRPAKANDWPSTLIFRTEQGFCTSTAIGNRLILTAAHCVYDGAQGVVKFGDHPILVSCKHHPDYNDNYSADIAICSTSEDIPAPKFERVNTRENLVQLHDQLVLIGYGCRQIGGGGPVGKLYEGSAETKRLAIGTNFYVETRGGPAICSGDSGGAAFRESGLIRFVIGVNSQGDLTSRSLLASLTTPETLEFIKTQANNVGSKICGVDDDAEKCR